MYLSEFDILDHSYCFLFLLFFGFSITEDASVNGCCFLFAIILTAASSLMLAQFNLCRLFEDFSYHYTS